MSEVKRIPCIATNTIKGNYTITTTCPNANAGNCLECASFRQKYAHTRTFGCRHSDIACFDCEGLRFRVIKAQELSKNA